ncbi:hypothetical protein [Methylorubrum zatmanii]|uniref:ATPase n=1 Tax=Methylorubrum zatmanii TaxID=29429 RepID=A0ABW1WH85_9HYPH|nr:hypothetical protein [Methylorubrum zatmanii]MBD8909087.1 hypothetical protein [Methylorubrum zatmanii]
MPLRDLFEWARSLFAERQPTIEPPAPAALTEAAPAPVYDGAALQASLTETRRRLAVADHRLRILEGSNRTAIRAFRRIMQEREQLVAAREAAEAERAIAVGDRQRTMMLNDHLLSELRASEEARLRLEEENRRLSRPAPAAAPAAEPRLRTGSGHL